MVMASAEPKTKAGTRPLRVLADPINVAILREIGSGEIGADELIARTRHASRSTRFSRLQELEGQRLLERETLASVPRRSRYRLTRAGQDLLPVAERIEHWLRPSRPQGRAAVAPPPAPVAVRALAMGWSTEILHRLGERPRSLTELACRIDLLGYHRVRHSLRTLHGAELVTPARGGERSCPYRLTSFARRATVAIAAAIRWEERNLAAKVPPLAAADAQALLLLPAPLIELPAALSGSCTLRVEGLGQIALEVSGGRVASWAAGTDGGPNRVGGTREEWRQAVGGQGLAPLAARGDERLLAAVVAGLEPYLG
jgi:DNA-binding HxlR family transcriptional regulator